MHRNSSIQFYNQVINLFWTGLSFTPVLWFWVINGPDKWLYLFSGLSLAFILLPEEIFQSFRIFKSKRAFEKVGVKVIRKFVQNGDWVKKMNGNKSILITTKKSSMAAYLHTITMYERYHWMCFVFFLLTSIYSFIIGNITIALSVLAANIIYNISSILLQQYNKIRIEHLPGIKLV